MPLLTLLNQHVGPLPITVPLNAPSDGPSWLMVTGSVWSQHANTMLGIEVSLDGKPIGTASIFSNNQAVHRATVPTYIPLQLQFGAHTLTLSVANANTVSDSNDVFDAVLMY